MKMSLLALGAVASVSAVVAAAEPSRAAWWLLRDEVKPIADLSNRAGSAKPPYFADRIGSFQVKTEGRALLITGVFPRATVWRFDLTTFDQQFDLRRTYATVGGVAYPDANSIWSRHVGKLLGDPGKGLTHTGPWDIYKEWKTPTARVALDGEHIYTSWFDIPSLEDQKAGRVYASFALDIEAAGKHTVRISFDDFERGGRWRPGCFDRPVPKPQDPPTPNPLRPHNIGSISIGVDERVRALEDVALKPELVGKHPRFNGTVASVKAGPPLDIDAKEVQAFCVRADPDRGEVWEYSLDKESMASGNDMDAGSKGYATASMYDRLLPRLTPAARKEVDKYFLKRFRGMYRYWVFQRNWNATGYAQNHNSKAGWALLGAALVWDGPEARKWLRWAVMNSVKRVELLAEDGGLEMMNEGRSYGLGFWQRAHGHIRNSTGLDIARGPFFDNEWRYVLYNASAFARSPRMVTHTGRSGTPTPVPAELAAENTPTSYHFADCDQVFMRTGWDAKAMRVRFMVGSVFGKKGTPKALRYNWAHCQVNRGSIAVWQGERPTVNEPGFNRTYRKGAGNNNCILVNGVDQWGGGQVWHPQLTLDQVGKVAFFADGKLLSAARADLAGAYPPEARIRTLSRLLVQLKPDHFLVFDRLETEGSGKAEWRFHVPHLEAAAGGGRFTGYGFRHDRKGKDHDSIFVKDPNIRLEIGFLTPGVVAAVGFSDVYSRSRNGLRDPLRHLKVLREGAKPMALLTAFAPKLRLEAKGDNVYAAKSGDVSWTVIVGGGAADGLESDAFLAIAAHDQRSGVTELLRFGGSRLKYKRLAISSPATDLFAVVEGGKLVRQATTK